MGCWVGSRDGPHGWSHDGGPGGSCRACWPTCRASTAGRSPSTLGMPPLTGCSTCLVGRCGTTTGSAMTCAPTWSSTLAIPRRCWSSTRPGTLRRALRRWGAAPGHRHRRPHRERPDRRLPALRHRCRARHDRPGAVCVPRLDQGSGTLGDRGCPRPGRVRHQAGPGHGHARAGVGRRGAGRLGNRRRGLRHRPQAAGRAGAPRHRLCVGGGLRPPSPGCGDTYRADALLRRVPTRAWQWVSAGRGAKGHRYDDWAFIQLDHGDPTRRPGWTALAAGLPQPQDR
jgi:hypothetical protein